MAQFSGAVKIGDLNDFIAPSQACVVSLQGQKQAQGQATAVKAPPAAPEGLQLNARPSKRHAAQNQQNGPPQDHANDGDSTTATAATTTAAAAAAAPQPQQTGGFQQTVLSGENQAVKVSLNDCLACSGCVTSAETVLLQAQSLKEFMVQCEDPDVHVVVSISPQSRASLAALHGISTEEVHTRVSHFLKHQLSVTLVLDISLGQALALTESAAEFVTRFKEAGRMAAAGGSQGSNGKAGQLPMLASACPGWVCYAEKTHGSYILPHIATTRSPQGIMGAIIKQRLAPAKGWDPARIYHVTVMPCYDKKLEASRDDFLVPGTSVAEVDSSLTTGELQELLDKFGAGDLKALPSGRGDNLLSTLVTATQQQQQQQQQQEPLRVPEPVMHAQLGSSGGYADFIFVDAAQQLYGVDVSAASTSSSSTCGESHTAAGSSDGSSAEPSSSGSSSSRLPWKVLRNADMQELQLLGPDGQPLLRFALAYGFRNIQTIVRQIKLGRCPYDYVEVMACPSGCLNGGGQLKAPKGVTAAQLLEQLELQYFRQQAGLGQTNGPPQEQQQQPQQQYSTAPGSIQLLQPVQQQDGQQQQQQQQQQGLPAASAIAPSCISSQALSAAYRVLLCGSAGAATVKELLHTQYHKREKTVTSTISDW